MSIIRDDQHFIDTAEQATRVAVVSSGGGSVERQTEYVRYADAGPDGVSAHGTHAITAGKRSYSIAVSAASSVDSPRYNGVAIPEGVVLEFEASPGDTLEAAELITSAGDDVLYVSVA